MRGGTRTTRDKGRRIILTVGDPLDPIKDSFTSEASPFEDEQAKADAHTTPDLSRQTCDDDNYFSPLNTMDTDTEKLNNTINSENRQINQEQSQETTQQTSQTRGDGGAALVTTPVDQK